MGIDSIAPHIKGKSWNRRKCDRSLVVYTMNVLTMNSILPYLQINWCGISLWYRPGLFLRTGYGEVAPNHEHLFRATHFWWWNKRLPGLGTSPAFMKFMNVGYLLREVTSLLHRLAMTHGTGRLAHRFASIFYRKPKHPKNQVAWGGTTGWKLRKSRTAHRTTMTSEFFKIMPNDENV